MANRNAPIGDRQSRRGQKTIIPCTRLKNETDKIKLAVIEKGLAAAEEKIETVKGNIAAANEKNAAVKGKS